MAQTFTSYEVDNDRTFNAALKRASELTDDLTIPLTEISKDFYKSERAIFNLGSSGQYEDLDDEYKEQKIEKWGFAYPILKASGDLERSVTDPSDKNAINEIINKKALVIGTQVEYGVYHQSDRPRSKIPLRKFLFIGPESRFALGAHKGRLERWMAILDGHMGQVLEDLGEFKRGTKS